MKETNINTESRRSSVNPCIKETEIKNLQDEYSSNRDLLIELKTLVEKLVNYQINEANLRIKDHEKRIIDLEKLSNKVVAWASVGGAFGGLVFNLVAKYIR